MKGLYIPHSSDKTVQTLLTELVAHNFTSHIVQIKHKSKYINILIVVFFTSHIVQIKPPHLPPKSNIDNTPILGICQVVQVGLFFREPPVGN